MNNKYKHTQQLVWRNAWMSLTLCALYSCFLFRAVCHFNKHQLAFFNSNLTPITVKTAQIPNIHRNNQSITKWLCNQLGKARLRTCYMLRLNIFSIKYTVLEWHEGAKKERRTELYVLKWPLFPEEWLHLKVDHIGTSGWVQPAAYECRHC